MIRAAIIMLALAAIGARGEVRTVAPPREMLPALITPPTRTELAERQAIRAARALRAKALADLATASGAATGQGADSAAISNSVQAIEQGAAILGRLGNVIDDTRASIPEAQELSSATIAELYLRQAKKTADELEAIAPTNSLEYLIGAGIRADINNNTEESTK